MPVKPPIKLVRDNLAGLYTEQGTDGVSWTPDTYTEPREFLYDCEVCGKPIEDWDLWTCLDGGEAAHTSCVEIVPPETADLVDTDAPVTQEEAATALAYMREHVASGKSLLYPPGSSDRSETPRWEQPPLAVARVATAMADHRAALAARAGRLGMPGYKTLRLEFATCWDGEDPWGSTLSWWFAALELLFHEGEQLPASWQFQDSPLHADGGYEPDGSEEEMLADMFYGGDVTLADVRTFADVLTKYLALLKAAGKNY